MGHSHSSAVHNAFVLSQGHHLYILNSNTFAVEETLTLESPILHLAKLDLPTTGKHHCKKHVAVFTRKQVYILNVDERKFVHSSFKNASLDDDNLAHIINFSQYTQPPLHNNSNNDNNDNTVIATCLESKALVQTFSITATSSATATTPSITSVEVPFVELASRAQLCTTNLLVTYSEKSNTVIIYHTLEGKKFEFSPSAEKHGVFDIVPVSDSMFVLAACDSVSAWNFQGMELFHVKKFNDRRIGAVKYLPNNRMLLIAHETRIHVYQVAEDYASVSLKREIPTTLHDNRFHMKDIDQLIVLVDKVAEHDKNDASNEEEQAPLVIARNNAGIRVVNLGRGSQLHEYSYDTSKEKEDSTKEDIIRVFNNITVVDNKHLCLLTIDVHSRFKMNAHTLKLKCKNSYSFKAIGLRIEKNSHGSSAHTPAHSHSSSSTIISVIEENEHSKTASPSPSHSPNSSSHSITNTHSDINENCIPMPSKEFHVPFGQLLEKDLPHDVHLIYV